MHFSFHPEPDIFFLEGGFCRSAKNDLLYIIRYMFKSNISES